MIRTKDLHINMLESEAKEYLDWAQNQERPTTKQQEDE